MLKGGKFALTDLVKMTVGQLVHTTSVRRRTEVNRSLGEATINPVPHDHYHCQNPPQYHHHRHHHKPMDGAESRYC